MFPKEKTWSKKAYRDAAKGESCKLRLPGCINAKETVALAHCPGWLNKIVGSGVIGAGKKTDDHNAVDACHHCHNLLDMRDPPGEMKTLIAKAFTAGRYLTIVNRIERGILT